MTPNVQFETESELEHSFPMSGARKKAGMTQWVINHSGGLIRNEKQANYILMGIVVLAAFIMSVLLFSNGNVDGGTKKFYAPF
jgi:hypothetical protein